MSRFHSSFDTFGKMGGSIPSAPSAGGVADLTVVWSDDPTGDTGAVYGQTLDNGLGGTDTVTWGALIATGSGITYGSNVITVVNNGTWRGDFVGPWAATGSKIGVDLTSVNFAASGSFRLNIRTTTSASKLLFVEFINGSKPTVQAYDGNFDLNESFDELANCAATENVDYKIRVEDVSGAIEITLDQGGTSQTIVYNHASQSGYRGDSGDAWRVAIQNYETAGGDATIGGIAGGTWG